MPKYKGRKCNFCEDQINYVDYKDLLTVTKYVSQYWKIVPSYYSGTCLKHQKMLAKAIKTAREMSLIPYTTQ
ncbi:30S ribosomal protein S18 [Patescibacteria group bacterium]